MKHNRKDYPKKCPGCSRWLTFKNAPDHGCFLSGEFGEMQKRDFKPVKPMRKYTQSKYEARYMCGE